MQMLHALSHVTSGLHPGCFFFSNFGAFILNSVQHSGFVFSFFFSCSDKPSVKWCHGDSSSCSILMWQIKSCCWQVYRQLYLGKCTHGLSTSKYFPLEKNITVIYGWSSVSEITPVAILLLLVASCLILGIVFLCSTTHEPPPQQQQQKNLIKAFFSTFDIIHPTVKRQKRLKLSGCIRNKCADDASPGVCWLTDQMVLVHNSNSQQQLIPSRQEDMRLTGWRRVQRGRLSKTSEKKYNLPSHHVNTHVTHVSVFNSMKITFLLCRS